MDTNDDMFIYRKRHAQYNNTALPQPDPERKGGGREKGGGGKGGRGGEEEGRRD